MSQKVWLITGSAAGFGRSLAAAALERGDKVVLTGRKREPLEAIASDYPGLAKVFLLDVTKADEARAAIAFAEKVFGRLDVLVNNAGFGLIGALEEYTEAQIRRNFETNVFGPIHVMRAALPLLRRQKSGHIVNLSAIAGFDNELGFSVYGGAKFALEGISEAVRGEAGPLGIRVTVVEPGPFRTDFIAKGLERGENHIADYAGTSGKFAAFLDKINGQQPGDPNKAAKAILAVVDSPNPPQRLVLGKFAYDKFEKKLGKLTEELAAWKAVGLPTDF